MRMSLSAITSGIFIAPNTHPSRGIFQSGTHFLAESSEAMRVKSHAQRHNNNNGYF